MKAARYAVGLAVWLALPAAFLFSLGSERQRHARDQWLPQLWSYATGSRNELPLAPARPIPLAVGDSIFLETAPGMFRQVGEVRRAAGRPGRNTSDSPKPRNPTTIPGQPSTEITASALLYPNAPAPHEIARLTYYRTPESLTWVVETMLPAEKRREIALEVTAAFERHHEEIVASLRPMVEASLRDALLVVEEDLPATLARHQAALQRIGTRYQHDLVEREIVPLVRAEVWPIVQREAEPLMTEIGNEIWHRASLWRFGWRFAYDRSPLPEKNLVRQEWTRFLQEQAVPVLQDHTDELIRIQQRVLAEVARNEQVQRVMRQSMARILGDAELQAVVGAMVRDLFVDNPRIREVFAHHWRSPAAYAVYQQIGSQLEPTVTRIGELLIGTPEGGITPEFARVLRNRILAKEQRWLVIELRGPDSGEAATRRAVPVDVGGPPRHNPFVPEFGGQ